MTSPYGPITLIANLQAGRRRAQAAVAEVGRVLDGAGVEHEVRVTEGPGHATALARSCLEAGGRFVVAVGGDGTVHEVVNGMVEGVGTVRGGGGGNGGPVLGVVAAGSGCDFVRTFGLPAKARAAAERLCGADVWPLDVGRIAYAGGGAAPEVRAFANIAEAGLGAATATRAAALPRRLGQSRYLVAFWAALPPYRAGSLRIEVDGKVGYEGRAVNVVMANCRYFGGGMHISPSSDPADGLLEVLVFTGRKTDSFTLLPRVYRGRHLPHPHITELQGRRFVLEGDRPFPIEADGEVLGTTPATVEVVPGALSLKV